MKNLNKEKREYLTIELRKNEIMTTFKENKASQIEILASQINKDAMASKGWAYTAIKALDSSDIPYGEKLRISREMFVKIHSQLEGYGTWRS